MADWRPMHGGWGLIGILTGIGLLGMIPIRVIRGDGIVGAQAFVEDALQAPDRGWRSRRTGECGRRTRRRDPVEGVVAGGGDAWIPRSWSRSGRTRRAG